MMDVSTKDRIRPVMSDNEIDLYLRYLSDADSVLEYGVGGSTVLAAESGIKSLYSIDTDGEWIGKVAKQPAVSKMISSGSARLVHEDIGPLAKWGKPANASRFYRWPRFARRPWRDGVKPDLALVDGRFRASCVLQCFLHGGPDLKVAIHDFWNRDWYHGVLRFSTVIDRVDKLAVLQVSSGGWLAGVRRLRHMYDPR